MLQRFLDRQLPPFARSTHPILRYTMQGRGAGRSGRVLRMFLFGAAFVLLVLGSYVINTIGFRFTAEPASLLDRVFLICYWPLVLLQVFMRFAAFGATTSTVSDESARETWESLKITTEGAALTLRTRWASVFYALAPLLLLVVGARVVFVVFQTVTLTTEYNGRFIDLMLSGTTPLGTEPVLGFGPIMIGIFIFAMQMTTALLSPFVALAFDAALGTFIGTVVRDRWIGLLGRLLFTLLRMAVTGFSLLFGALALGMSVFGAPGGFAPADAVPFASALRGLVGAFLGLTEGDLGLNFLSLAHVQRLYTGLDYGVFIGVAALLYMLLQAFAARALLNAAVRRASRADRR